MWSSDANGKQQTQWPYFFLLPQEILQGPLFNFKHVWLPFKPRGQSRHAWKWLMMGYVEKQTEVEDDLEQWLSSRFASGLSMLWRPNTVKYIVQTLKGINFFWRSPDNFNLHQHSVEFDWIHDLLHQQKRYGIELYIIFCFKSLFILMYYLCMII